jgi:hypothetical protein
MMTVSAPTRRAPKTPYLLTITGLVATLALGIAIGWQIGEHRSGNRQSATHSQSIVVPQIQGPAAGAASANSDTGTSALSVPAASVQGGPGEANAGRTAPASNGPASIVTVYLVGTPADAAGLQDLLDRASRLGDSSDGSAWILVAGTPNDALDASAAIDTAKSRYGTDRVQVIDMRTLVAGR